MKAAIFDMDGLMYDTERIATEAWLDTADKMGFTLTRKQCDSFRGTNMEYKRKFFFDNYAGSVNYDEAFKRRQEYIDNYIRENGVPVKKGLYELMNALKERKYKIAVATSTSREKAAGYWKQTHIDSFLDADICGNEVTKSKPDPEIFLKAADKLSVPIEQCFILEDSFNGIEAARNAGGKVIMIPDMVMPTDEIRKKCDYVLNNLEKVVDIL